MTRAIDQIGMAQPMGRHPAPQGRGAVIADQPKPYLSRLRRKEKPFMLGFFAFSFPAYHERTGPEEARMHLGRHMVGSPEWNHLEEMASALTAAIRIPSSDLLFCYQPDREANAPAYLRDLESTAALFPYRGEGSVSVFRRTDIGISPRAHPVCLEMGADQLPLSSVAFRVDLATRDIAEWARNVASGISAILDADPEPSF